MNEGPAFGPELQGFSYPFQARYEPWVQMLAGRAIRDLLQNRTDAGYWCYRLQEWKPQLGDIVCWGRQAGIDYDHQDGGNYKGHSDIVVEARNDSVEVIGGNVGNSVTRRALALNAQGFFTPVIQHGENLFGIMRCRL
jgi:hypothetical protein